MNLFNDVGLFHERLGLPCTSDLIPPHLLSDEAFRYRLACLNEEMRELTEAHASKDLAAFADAIADLIWFVIGTGHMAHLPMGDIWDEVRLTNMEKRLWVEGDPLKPRNGTSLEVVKPPGWKPPDIQSILDERTADVAAWKEQRDE